MGPENNVLDGGSELQIPLWEEALLKERVAHCRWAEGSTSSVAFAMWCLLPTWEGTLVPPGEYS